MTEQDLKDMTIDELLVYICSNLDKRKRGNELYITYSEGYWIAAIDGVARIKEKLLKTALYWLALHILKGAKDEDFYYR